MDLVPYSVDSYRTVHNILLNIWKYIIHLYYITLDIIHLVYVLRLVVKMVCKGVGLLRSFVRSSKSLHSISIIHRSHPLHLWRYLVVLVVDKHSFTSCTANYVDFIYKNYK